MTKLINELDHVLCKVGDADEAAAIFERLGFVSTPLSSMEGLGIGNRLIIFPQRKGGCLNFIELLAVTHPPDVRPAMAALLDGADGPKSIILSGDSAAQARPMFNELGVAFDTPNVVERDWRMANGDIEKPAFSILPPLSRSFSFAFLEYLNLSPYTRPEWLGHTNSVRGMTGVVGVSEDPAAAIELFSRMFDCPARQGADGLYETTPGMVRLKIGAADAVSEKFGQHISPGERYVGVELISENPPATERVFSAAGFDIISVRGGIALRADCTAGLAVAVNRK